MDNPYVKKFILSVSVRFCGISHREGRGTYPPTLVSPDPLYINKRCKQWKKTSAIEKFENFHLWNITQKI